MRDNKGKLMLVPAAQSSGIKVILLRGNAISDYARECRRSWEPSAVARATHNPQLIQEASRRPRGLVGQLTLVKLRQAASELVYADYSRWWWMAAAVKEASPRRFSIKQK